MVSSVIRFEFIRGPDLVACILVSIVPEIEFKIVPVKSGD